MKNYLICYYILQQVMFETLEEDLSVLLTKISPELWENGKPADKALFDTWSSIIDADKMTPAQMQTELSAKLSEMDMSLEKTISVISSDSFEYYLSQAYERAEEYLAEYK